MAIITAYHVITALRDAMRADSWLGDPETVPTIICSHSGTFDTENLPKPCIVLAPENERNPYPPVTRNAQKLVRVILHAYTQFYGMELGMIGDTYTTGLMPLLDHLEAFADDNLLGAYLGAFTGWVARAHALEKIYPDPYNQNYPDLNEGRVVVEYLTINPALV
jgi:hypothetical protein